MIYGGETERDRAVEARIGGNLYRTRINGNIHTQPGFYRDERRMAQQDEYIRQDAESLYENRSHLVGRYYARTDPTPENPARFWGQDHEMWPRSFTAPLLPEAAFDWPIYRAAMVAQFNAAEDRRITAMMKMKYPQWVEAIDAASTNG